MATATRLERRSRSSQPETAPETGPTIQETLTAPETSRPETSRPETSQPDNFAARFVALTMMLHACIIRQSRAYVRYYAERGAIALDALNVKLSRATNKATRDKARANGMDALQLTAKSACDESSEPTPRVERWISIHALGTIFPRALDLPSVSGALALVPVISRVDPPVSFDAPETYYLKPRYDRERVAQLIERAITENLPADEIAAALEIIGGKTNPDPVKADSTDPIAAARTLAKGTVEKIMEGKIDPFTFFDDFVSIARQYGYEIQPGRDGNGATTHKLVKLGR